jgi:succinate dehydrogenase/fumarate reductase flavoprotein subunit
MPAPPAVIPAEDFRPVTQYNSIHMIVVNLAGKRFVDESIYDSITTQALCREPQALGFLLCDGRIDDHDRRHRATPTSQILPTDRMRHIVEHGGVVISAESTAALADMLAEHGVYRAGLLATLEEFNQAALAGTTAELAVPKVRHAHPLDQPPFYALPVVPGISFTDGGIAIDARTRALDWQNEPVPGLFAAGADAGGVFYEQYLGGASSSLVLGRQAGAAAVEEA